MTEATEAMEAKEAKEAKVAAFPSRRTADSAVQNLEESLPCCPRKVCRLGKTSCCRRFTLWSKCSPDTSLRPGAADRAVKGAVVALMVAVRVARVAVAVAVAVRTLRTKSLFLTATRAVEGIWTTT